jgi:hypothetical protein
MSEKNVIETRVISEDGVIYGKLYNHGYWTEEHTA